jgi:hypothetical protein
MGSWTSRRHVDLVSRVSRVFNCRTPSQKISGNYLCSRLTGRGHISQGNPVHYQRIPSNSRRWSTHLHDLFMLFHRTQPVHALVVATSVAGLGAPISTAGSAPSRHILSSRPSIIDPSMASNIVNTASVLSAGLYGEVSSGDRRRPGSNGLPCQADLRNCPLPR